MINTCPETGNRTAKIDNHVLLNYPKEGEDNLHKALKDAKESGLSPVDCEATKNFFWPTAFLSLFSAFKGKTFMGIVPTDDETINEDDTVPVAGYLDGESFSKDYADLKQVSHSRRWYIFKEN